MILMESDIFGTVIWFFMFFIIIFLYPRMMLSQLIWSLEQSAKKMEDMSSKTKTISAKKVMPHPTKELKERINDFMDFFVIEPSNLDPYGIVSKIDRIIRNMEDRFSNFVEEVGNGLSKKNKQELNYTLRAAIGMEQIAKVVRHYVEMAKKYKNLQIAMILKMQLPLIEQIANGELECTKAFANGWPIGDSIGPMVASSFIDNSKEIAEDVIVGKTKIEGRDVFVLKADGPSPHLGRIDEALEKILKNNKIDRIITIDAAAKLEGEKNGKVSEGVGFAMGGIGQREIIENIILPKKIPIDSVVVKVGINEAIEPMRKEIFESIPKVREIVKRSILRTKRNGKVILIGVGNSSGVGNDKDSVEKAKKIIEELDRTRKKREKKSGSWI